MSLFKKNIKGGISLKKPKLNFMSLKHRFLMWEKSRLQRSSDSFSSLLYECSIELAAFYYVNAIYHLSAASNFLFC